MSQNGKEEAQPAMPEPAVEAPKYPDKLEDIDRLFVENIFLKMKNLELTIKDLDAQKREAGMQLVQLQAKMKEKQGQLEKKYGVPMGPGTSSVAPDGTIIRARPPTVEGKLADGTTVKVPASALAPDNNTAKV